jgi:predicted AAA+ superfamily ATPase
MALLSDFLVRKRQYRLTAQIPEALKVPLFRRYLQKGYLPFILEGEDTYPLKLDQIINTVLDTDLAYTEGYGSGRRH